jgi:hypothetical protein
VGNEISPQISRREEELAGLRSPSFFLIVEVVLGGDSASFDFGTTALAASVAAVVVIEIRGVADLGGLSCSTLISWQTCPHNSLGD